MKKGGFANENVVDDYLSDLLTEEALGEDIQRQAVARLLDSTQAVIQGMPETDDIIPSPVEPESSQVLNPEVEKEVAPLKVEHSLLQQTPPTEAFQVLYFEVAGLTLAVPLTELGGIHELEKINPMLGQSPWFKGVMLHRDEKFNVVDTARWVMPEKNAEKLAESTKYQYLIVLERSGWGLACESLVTTVTLQPDEVKWRRLDKKRPWLAGMVKKKMCALVNVKQLINMLNQGLSSNV